MNFISADLSGANFTSAELNRIFRSANLRARASTSRCRAQQLSARPALPR
jgi:uncharacterized protein YjbI with pentapeptide repeats